MLTHNTSLPLLLIGCGLLTAPFAAAQETANNSIEQRAHDTLAAFLDESPNATVSTSIIIGGEAIFHETRGSSSRRSNLPVTNESPFPAASMAHAFLVTVALQFESDDKLSHEDRVVSYLPKLLPENCPVRIGELMSHTSGLPDIRDFMDAQAWAAKRPTYEALLGTIPDLTPPMGAGDCVRINPTDTILLAALLEHVSEKSAPELLATHLFSRLEMAGSGYQLPSIPAEAAHQETKTAPLAFLPRGLFTTAADLQLFQRGLNDLTLLDSEQLGQMNTMVRLTDGKHSDCGLGVRRVQLHDTPGLVLGEPTEFGAAQVTYYPSFDMTVAVLIRNPGIPADTLARDLARLVIEKPVQGVLDLPLTPSELEPYLGSYQIGCSTVLIRSRGARILVDEVDQEPLIFLYQGDHSFVAQEDSDVRLVFKLENGEATSFLLDRHGLRSRAVRFQSGG